MPHIEGDATDPKCRHKSKLHTETYLTEKDIPYKSIRLTYIYCALNNNPPEEWFFLRILAGPAVPIPGSGVHLTGLGHVEDLANAMGACLGNDEASSKCTIFRTGMPSRLMEWAEPARRPFGRTQTTSQSSISAPRSSTRARKTRSPCDRNTSFHPSIRHLGFHFAKDVNKKRGRNMCLRGTHGSFFTGLLPLNFSPERCQWIAP